MFLGPVVASLLVQHVFTFQHRVWLSIVLGSSSCFQLCSVLHSAVYAFSVSIVQGSAFLSNQVPVLSSVFSSDLYHLSHVGMSQSDHLHVPILPS